MGPGQFGLRSTFYSWYHPSTSLHSSCRISPWRHRGWKFTTPSRNNIKQTKQQSTSNSKLRRRSPVELLFIIRYLFIYRGLYWSRKTLGSISAIIMSGLPSPRRTAGHVSGKSCLWRRFLIKILAALLAARNVILMTVFDGPTWHLRLITFVPVPFSPPFLLILAFQPILFHTVVKRSFLEKVEQSRAVWLWCGKWHVKGHIYVGEHNVNTMFLFCSVQFALDHLKINFAWLRQRLVSLSFEETMVHINLPEYYFRHSIFFLRSMFVLSLFVDFLFVSWHSRTTRFKY